MLNVDNIPNAEVYCRRIRNVTKRIYAGKYMQFLLSGKAGIEPEWRPLSYMAAQAARMNLRDLLIEEE